MACIPLGDDDKSHRTLTLWRARTLKPIFTHEQLEPIMASIGFFPIVQPGTQSATKENTDDVNVEQGENLEEGSVALAASMNPVRAAFADREMLVRKALAGMDQPERVVALLVGADQVVVQWREYEFRNMNVTIMSLGFEFESRPRPRLPYPRVDGLHLMSYLTFLAAIESYVNPYIVMNLFIIRPTSMNSIDRGRGSIYKPITNFEVNVEIEDEVIYYYRRDTIERASEEKYSQLKASVGDISNNESSKMYVRKDGQREIEEDDLSDFVCLIDDDEALHGDIWDRW